MNEPEARSRLVEICKLLYDRQLTVSAGGNMSVRLEDGNILITPSGRNKGMLRPEDMVKLDIDGNVVSGGKPSIEHRFHLALYRRRPDTNAIVHCHPLHCVALAVKETPVKSNMTPEGVLLLGNVPMVEYQTPGSEELVDAVERKWEYDVMLMSKHGALTQGRTLEEAYNRMEELEFQAKLQLLVPDAENLEQNEIEKLEGMR